MSIPINDLNLIYQEIILKMKEAGLYITSAQDRVRYYGDDRFPVPINQSPTQTSGSESAIEVIANSIVEGVTDYYSSAFSVYGDTKVTINKINVWRGAGPGDTTDPLPGDEGPGWFNQTCVGFESGESFTTGNDNTAFGYRTLKNASTAVDCTTVGADAMLNMVSGVANTALGWRALMLMPGGSGNVAIGHRAQGESTAGDRNVSVGGRSLFVNLGQNNIAIGHQSMESNTSGSNNVSIGYLSQQASTTQNRNTSVGARTIEFLSASPVDEEIGADNTVVGWSAMQSLTEGHTNTAIGLQAGRRLVGNVGVATTVSNSCYIGANTNASTDGVTNENVFGFATSGMGSNTVTIGNNMITDNYLTGRLRVGAVYASRDDSPGLYLNETDQEAENAKWVHRATGGVYQIMTQNAAENDGVPFIKAARVGLNVSAISIGSESYISTINVSGYGDFFHTAKFRGNINIDNVTPTLRLIENDQSVDAKKWFIRSTGSTFQVQTQNDDENDGNLVFAVTRSGTVPQEMSMGNGVKVNTAAPNTTRAGFRLVSGTDPTSPQNGDLWFDGTNLKFQVAGVTRTLTWT